MTPSALIIHSDENRRRFACDALVMFRPGYRVRTAENLDVGGDWLDVLAPDIVILEAAITRPADLRRWADKHRLDARRTVLFGSARESVDDLGAATVGERVRLPDLMKTVSAVAERATYTNYHSHSLISQEGTDQ